MLQRSIVARSPSPSGLEQKPRPPLGLIDEVFQQAGGGHVCMLVAQRVRFAQMAHQLLIVFAQLSQHVARSDITRVVIQDTLQPPDLADRSQGRATDLAHALSDRVGRGEDLLPLLVEEKMIVAEMRARYVPME